MTKSAGRWSYQPRKAAGSNTLPSSEEDSHGTKNVTGKSPLKNSLSLEDLSQFHFHQSSLGPVPDTHLPLKLLFITHFASRVCSSMHEIWPRACREQGLQMAGGMALGYSEEVAHIWPFSLNKTNFLNVKIYIKAKLDIQTYD